MAQYEINTLNHLGSGTTLTEIGNDPEKVAKDYVRSVYPGIGSQIEVTLKDKVKGTNSETVWIFQRNYKGEISTFQLRELTGKTYPKYVAWEA